MNTAVCITGAHRSGTSMVTRALNLLGLFLGPEDDISTRAEDNPEGFWENIQFVRLNDEILAQHRGAWDMPPNLRMGWELHPSMTPYYHKAQQLVKNFKGHPIWGWKDPRSALTIDFWQKILPNQKVVICVRNPLEVVQSLSKRGYSSPVFSFNLWLSYNEHLVATIAPENRIITHFESYFVNPRAELERVSSFLGISFSEEQITAALASISLPLRHNKVGVLDILQYNPPFEMLKLYQKMCLQAGPVYQTIMESEDKNNILELDILFTKNISSEPEHYRSEGPSISIDEFISTQQMIPVLETQVATVQSQLADMQLDVQQKENDLLELTSKYYESNTRLAEMENQLAAIRTYTQQKELDLREKENNLLELLGKYYKSNTRLAEMENQLASMHIYTQQKEQDLRIAVSFIENLHRSIGWRLLLRYRSKLDRFAPPGSLLRHIHDLPLYMYRRLKRTLVPETRRSHSEESQPSQENVQAEAQRQVGVCTIASKNYLSLVRVFAESMARSNPDVPVYVLLVDRIENKFDPEKEPYHVITLEELDNIPNAKHLFFKYTPIELNTAVKPYFLEHLMHKFQLEKICYFDPDIYVFSKLDAIWELLEKNFLVLTPHITTPYPDDCHPTEIDINLAGVFNLGFAGISSAQETAGFLAWWKDRLYDYCYMNPSQGMHVDQNWVNFAPVMHDRVFILRDLAYNIAYWNLHERGHRLRFEAENLYIDDRPVVFFHFSGFNPKALETISIHQNRFSLNDFPNVRPVYEFYRDLIEKASYSTIKRWPYAFGRFENGVKIPLLARTLYGKLGRQQTSKFGNPFAVNTKHSFFSWINEAIDGLVANGQPTLTRLHMEVHNVRSDLQKTFPDPLGADREKFIHWLSENAARDFDLDDVFIAKPHPAKVVVEQGYLRSLGFAAWRFTRASHGSLKNYAKRVLPSDSSLFQRLKYVNKKYLEKTIQAAPQQPNPPVRHAPRAQSTLPFGVNVAGYIQGEFGVAEVARASLKSLAASGVAHTLNNVQTQAYRHQDPTFDGFSNENPYSVNLVHVNADQAHEFARQKGTSYFQDRYNIACWFWELSSFPKQWYSSFDYYQEIWVASGFCQESIASHSPIPVVKMTFPILVDDDHVQPNRKLFGLPEDKFLYGFMFDYMSFAERKNPYGLLKAFKMAFGQNDDVALVIKTVNAEHAPEKAQRLREAAAGCNVRFIDGYISRRDAISLMSSFDSFVSLHRSEGLGIGMAQAMYLGKPVIATGYSGNMEFMNHNNSFLVRYKLTELQENYGPYEKGKVWAEPDLEHAATLMRSVFDDRSLARQVAERAESDIKTRMTPEVAGQEMKSRLSMVA